MWAAVEPGQHEVVLPDLWVAAGGDYLRAQEFGKPKGQRSVSVQCANCILTFSGMCLKPISTTNRDMQAKSRKLTLQIKT